MIETVKGPSTSYIEEKYDFGGNNTVELPMIPPPGIMYVFYQGNTVMAVDFQCPCGCGSSCYTPTNQPHPRCWNYSPGPTITPSMRYLAGCKSHFNITNGKVIMHGDSGK